MVISSIEGIIKRFPGTIFYKGSICKNIDQKNFFEVLDKKKFNLKIYGLNSRRIPISICNPLLLFYSIKYFFLADLILEIPGEIPSDISFFSQFCRWLLAKVLNKPFVIFGCSLGPFKYKITKKIASFVYNRTNLVVTREEITKKYLEELGVKNLEIAADTAFLMKSEKSLQAEKEIKKFNRFAVLSIKWSYAKNKDYFEAVKEIAHLILNDNLEVVIVVHSEDDRKISEKLLNVLFSDKVHLLDSLFSPKEIKYIISKGEFFVGSRIHSCIASISSEVPALVLVPISDHRGVGMMNCFGLSEYVVDPSWKKEIIINKVIEFINRKEDVVNKIKENLGKVEEKTENGFKILEKFIYKLEVY